ncbi:ATP-binding protein [Sphingomonas sp. BIUV-7]|uniref:histidine kinase n=1 Tax=Sphingomonas natans TaxID=3063330 RepID=A0ABT8Y988_9SPHN|nr:ATP-binding protein [Sphingomonas sp. BIUV-7]MDO6414896.1 ATP-binding protein [Sphingomonas sp. BIUV-7]
MQLRRAAIATLLVSSISAPALAADFDTTIAASKAAMMANPAEAFARAEAADRMAARLPPGRPRAIAEATAEWLEGEAAGRLDRPADALPRLETALRKARTAGAGDKLVADILLSRGWSEGTLGRVQPALRDFQNAYSLYRRAGEQRGQAKALQNIGGIYHDAGDDEHSLAYYSQVAELAGDDPAIGLAARNNLGETLKALGRYHAAQDEYRQALVAARRLGSNLLEVRILTNLASAQVHDGEIAAGEASARRALALARGEAAGERPFAIGVLALAAERRGDLADAARLLDMTFAGRDLEQTPLSFRDFHESASRVYARLGQDRLAYRHLSAFKRLDDGARALAASTNAALMGARFDFANQRSRISDLKAGQARRDRQLAESRARYQTILFTGALGAGGVVLLVMLVSLLSLRRSRNEVRLANTQLSDSNESLAKALRAKSEFLATTSHEIRTPLNGILGMTQVMLADPRVGPDFRERIEIVHGAGETMRALVDDILDIAKIENGNLEITLAPFDPAELIRAAVRFWRGPAEDKGLAYAAELAPLPPLILGDETRLRQVLSNLLSNAVKFTPAGAVSLRAEAVDGRLVILVTDSGIGISESEQEAIFERFYQVDGGTTRQFGGTGLGLAICRHLTVAMGGGITVESALGGGSIFRIDLPLQVVAPPADLPVASFIGDTLLIVEPNLLAQRIVAKALRETAGDILFADTGSAAGALIRGGGISRVLVQADHFLQADDSMAELRRIAESARAAGLFLMLLHTPIDSVMDDALRALGADRLVAKPVAMKDVIAGLGLAPPERPRSLVPALMEN